MRIRNSPTNPLSPGTPIDDSITSMNPAAKIGATCWMPLSSEILRVVPALVDHPDEEEQRAGRHAVVDHLQHAARQRLRREGERAEHDEAHVGHRRVGDEAFEVHLHRGHDRAVEDADHRQRQPERRGSSTQPRGTGTSPKRRKPYVPSLSITPASTTEPAVGACVWASGSHVWNGKIGTLTANAMANAKNSQRPVEAAKLAPSAISTRSNVVWPRSRLARATVAIEADEHERRTEHREQEELRGRVDAVLVAPSADQEVHRHEHDLEEDEEHEQVEAEEAAHHAGLQQQQPRQVRPLVVVRVDRRRSPAGTAGR